MDPQTALALLLVGLAAAHLVRRVQRLFREDEGAPGACGSGCDGGPGCAPAPPARPRLVQLDLPDRPGPRR